MSRSHQKIPVRCNRNTLADSNYLAGYVNLDETDSAAGNKIQQPIQDGPRIPGVASSDRPFSRIDTSVLRSASATSTIPSPSDERAITVSRIDPKGNALNGEWFTHRGLAHSERNLKAGQGC